MVGSRWLAGMFRQYAPGHPQGCIWSNRSEMERLGPMLKERGGLAVMENTENLDEFLAWYGTPDATRFTMDVEYRSLFGKKGSKTVIIAFLTGLAV